MKKLLFSMAALAMGTVASAQPVTMSPVFTRPYDTAANQPTNPVWWQQPGGDNLTRSFNFNLASTYAGGVSLIAPARGSGDRIRVVNPTDGTELGLLITSNVLAGPGLFKYNALDVAGDGKIYATPLQSGVGEMAVWEWANDDAATTPVRIGPTGVNSTNRYGDCIAVTVDSTNPNIRAVFVGGNNAASSIAKFATTDGSTWTAVNLPIVGANLGVAATTPSGNIFLKTNSGPVREVDQAGTVITADVLAGQFQGGSTGLNYVVIDGVEYLGITSTNNPQAATGLGLGARVFDITNRTAPVLVWSTGTLTTPNNANINATSGMGFGKTGSTVRLAHLISNNIYAHYTTPDLAAAFDGTITREEYGAGYQIALQTVRTQFGDITTTPGAPDVNGAGSELDSLSIRDTATDLIIGLAGNFEINGNQACIFIDADNNGATGASTIPTNPFGFAVGTVLPTGFGADIAITPNAGGPGQSVYTNVHTFDSTVSSDFVGSTAGTSGAATVGTITGNVEGISRSFQVALDNSNREGVLGGDTPSTDSTEREYNVTRGLEISIPRALLVSVGAPTGQTTIKVFVAIKSGSSEFFSNQFLPALTVAGPNVGTAPNLSTALVPATYTYTNAFSTSVADWTLYEN